MSTSGQEGVTVGTSGGSTGPAPRPVPPVSSSAAARTAESAPPSGPRGAAAASATTATRPVTQGPQPGGGAAAAPRPPQKRAQGRPGAARPAQGAARRAIARRVKLAVARVDPWSVMKLSFLLAVAAGIAGVILTGVLWLILSGMGVFADVDRVIREVQPATTDPFSIMDYIGFGRVISLSIVVGVIDIILMTAISTLAAFLYNICSALVGGIQLTLTDD